MNEITIVAPQSIQETQTLASILSKSLLLPEALKGKEADIVYILMTGAELGLAPMQSLRGISIIKGKPTLYADTMAALVRRHRDVCEYIVTRERTAQKCVIETKRVGDPSPTVYTFTSQDAQNSGLGGQDNYRKYGPDMLFARCLSRTCRGSYSDLVLGLHDPDELAESELLVEREVGSPPPPVALAAGATKTDHVLQQVQQRVAQLKKPQPEDATIVQPPAPAPTPAPKPTPAPAPAATPAPAPAAAPAPAVVHKYVPNTWKSQPIPVLTAEQLAAALVEVDAWLAANPMARTAPERRAQKDDLMQEQAKRIASAVADPPADQEPPRAPGEDDAPF